MGKDLVVEDLIPQIGDQDNQLAKKMRMTGDQGSLSMAVTSIEGNLVEEPSQQTGDLDSQVEAETMMMIGSQVADPIHPKGDLGNLKEEMIVMKDRMAEDQTLLTGDQDALAEVAMKMRMIGDQEADLIHLAGDQDSQEEVMMRTRMKGNLKVVAKTLDQAASHPGKRMKSLGPLSHPRENSCTM